MRFLHLFSEEPLQSATNLVPADNLRSSRTKLGFGRLVGTDPLYTETEGKQVVVPTRKSKTHIFVHLPLSGRMAAKQNLPGVAPPNHQDECLSTRVGTTASMNTSTDSYTAMVNSSYVGWLVAWLT